MIEYAYRYSQPSQVEHSPSGSRIHLATTPRPERQPFFTGSLTSARRTADLMLALVQVVHSRFYTPPAVIARAIANSDPVITCGGERLRLEGFSACCGAYARLDLLPGAFDAERAETGTTNVDFNPPMRASLAGLREGAAARLTVSAGEFELALERASVLERKIRLPARWLKGFVEVQSHQTRMTTRFTMTGGMAQRFLRETPRTPVRTPVYVSAAGPAVRLSQTLLPNSVLVGGIERLRILEPIMRHAQSLTLYSGNDAATAWELAGANMRFFLVLSPERSRGFSGEGQALFHLAAEPAQKAMGAVRGALRWQSRIEAGALASELAIAEEAAQWALAQLGASGMVGYDLAESCYFHRELPFDLSQLDDLQPRLKEARKLASESGVRFESGEAWVRGTGVEHRVRKVDGEWRCTCPWIAKHGLDRGPCKHILAVRIAQGDDDAAD